MPGRAFSGRVRDGNLVFAPLIVAPSGSGRKLTSRRRRVPVSRILQSDLVRFPMDGLQTS